MINKIFDKNICRHILFSYNYNNIFIRKLYLTVEALEYVYTIPKKKLRNNFFNRKLNANLVLYSENPFQQSLYLK